MQPSGTPHRGQARKPAPVAEDQLLGDDDEGERVRHSYMIARVDGYEPVHSQHSPSNSMRPLNESQPIPKKVAGMVIS